MANYDHEQAAIIRDLRAAARKRYSDPHERSVKLKAALETGEVESGFHNLAGGDADSEGWRQERASIYKNPTNVSASINRFFDEADQHWDGKMDAGTLAAKVQRPAAQYANRYGLAGHKVQGLLKGDAGGSSASATSSSVKTTAPKLTPGGTTVDDNAALTDALLDHSHGTGGLLKRYTALVDSGNYTTTTASKVTPGKVSTTSSSDATPAGNADVDHEKAIADAINNKHLPYKWGGGHGDNSGLYDCSGFVSKVTGVNPRVASQFKTWGQAGQGKRVTVWAKDDHVIMEIDGHFVGTSSSNPGGGPGWIPRAKISKAYLAQFTPRHAAGQ